MNIKQEFTVILLSALTLGFFSTQTLAVDYPHNFAINPDAPSDQPCIYCHTPHNANTTAKALWNRDLDDPTSYTLYNSPTMDADVPMVGPSAITLLCLCCHDGLSATQVMMPSYSFHGGAGDCSNCHDVHGFGYTPMGDLTNDHPISIVYASGDPELRDVNFVLDNGLILYDGKVECASCHSVHDNTNSSFLRKANGGSALCYICHLK